MCQLLLLSQSRAKNNMSYPGGIDCTGNVFTGKIKGLRIGSDESNVAYGCSKATLHGSLSRLQLPLLHQDLQFWKHISTGANLSELA